MDRDIYAKLIAKIKTLATKINAVAGDTETVKTEIGTLASLETTDKTDLVSAINEVDGNADTANTAIGDLTDLTTTAKTDLVSALNELDADVTPLSSVLYKAIDIPTIAAGGYADITGTLSTPAHFGFVVGYIIQANVNVVPLKIMFTDKSTISVRVRNLTNSEISGGDIQVYYV